MGMIREYIIKISDEIMEEEIADRPQELVRCKNCAYAIYKEGLVQHGHIVCTKPFTERWQAVKPDDWFCADGEKRTDK